MSFSKCLFALFSVTVLFIFVNSQAVSPPNENCLGCICEGSSSCNVSTPCHVPYAGAYFCGPFLISYPYWSDAGKPVLGNDDPNRKGAFEACTLDLQCAAGVVKAYMQKFAQDCNGDGIIDCEDYVRIHGLGGYGCRDPSFVNTDFYKRYAKCFKVIIDASPRKDETLSEGTENETTQQQEEVLESTA